MLTYEDLNTRFQKITSDDSSANVTFGNELINETHKLICDMENWPFTEATYTTTSTASQQVIKLPAEVGRIITYKITSGGIQYTPEEITDPVKFDRINYNTTATTSDFPVYFHIRNNQILNFPAISSASLTITIEYYKLPKDMTATTNYTTGTVTTLAAAGTAVTGSGTTWTSAMIGRYIRITTEGNWYPITAVTDTTHLTIGKPYEGTAIAAGSEAYTIGELPLVPEAYQDLLWMRPVGMYFMMKGDEVRARYYYSGSMNDPGMYERLFERLKKRYSSKTSRHVYNYGIHIIDANYNPRSIIIT